MASYSYGSSGSGVKELQELLNSKGNYNLETDGVYGNKTQAAVRDYQQKNNLTVDGVAGDQTLGSLKQVAQKQEPAAPIEPSYQKEYTESDTVKQAQSLMEQQAALKPADYQPAYNEQLNALYEKIMNREPFEYDMNADALYQQYKDRYIQQGQMAMQDTMGQAAALTGGYGNTYAQGAGQQAYQQYLQGLNDKVPELYQLAMSKYQMEGDQMAEQYAMTMQQENQDYSRWQDQQNAWLTERDYLTGRYDSERSYDYGKWQDQRDFGVQQEATKYDRLVNLITSTGYAPTAQELADAGMSANEAAAYAKYYSDQNTPSYSGGGSGYSSGSDSVRQSSKAEGQLSSDKIEMLQWNFGLDITGVWDDATLKATGYKNMNEAWQAYMKGDLNDVIDASVGLMNKKNEQSEAAKLSHDLQGKTREEQDRLLQEALDNGMSPYLIEHICANNGIF